MTFDFTDSRHSAQRFCEHPRTEEYSRLFRVSRCLDCRRYLTEDGAEFNSFGGAHRHIKNELHPRSTGEFYGTGDRPTLRRGLSRRIP